MPWWSDIRGLALAAQWQPLESQLPFKCESFDLEIEAMSFQCSRCDGQLEEQRVEFHEYKGQCLNVRHVGVCHKCHLMTFGQHRFYADGTIQIEKEDGWYYVVLQRTLRWWIEWIWYSYVGICKFLAALVIGKWPDD